MVLFLVCLAIFAINIPFGFWRSMQKKFSVLWIVSVHGAVPFVAFLRHTFEISYTWSTLLFMIPAYFLGQRLGAYFHKQHLLKHNSNQ